MHGISDTSRKNLKVKYLRIFRTLWGDGMLRELRCSRQPCDSNECGYYILRYMREIMKRRGQQLHADLFGIPPSPYTAEEIDEVREEWLDYLQNFISS